VTGGSWPHPDLREGRLFGVSARMQILSKTI